MTWKLFNGDCLEVMKNIPDKSVDMILCDLPYGTTQCKWDRLIPFEPLWEQYERTIKDNGAILLFGKQPFTTDLINSKRKWYRYNLTWLKNIANGFLNAKVMPLQTTEDIVVFYKNKPIYNPQMEKGFDRKVSRVSSKRKCQQTEIYNKALCIKDYDSTERYPINVLYFKSDKHKNSLHPTQKPVALLEYLIRTYTNEGHTVLDNCAGSGTTGIAAEICGRHSIMIEKEENFCEQIEKRMYELENSKEISLFG